MSRRQRNVLFTFDYELYLGARSGTVDECLIIPTNKLLAILSRYRVKAIFFIDTTYLIKLREIKERHPRAKSDWQKIVGQLQSIFLQGHDVFSHLHPHWLGAKYNETSNEWDLSDFSKYRFNSISVEEKDYVWKESSIILSDVIHAVDAAYKFNGYRAGGWSIQPFSDFKPYFERYGIQNEFSVRPGYKQISTAHQYDFTDAPRKSIYAFEQDILAEDSNGRYKQYTISSVEKPAGIYKFIDRVLNRIFTALRLRAYGNGVTVRSKQIQSTTKDPYYEKLEMVSIEHLTLAKLKIYGQFLHRNSYMQFLSHPKSINAYHLFCLRAFLKYACRFYFLNTDFRKIAS